MDTSPKWRWWCFSCAQTKRPRGSHEPDDHMPKVMMIMTMTMMLFQLYPDKEVQGKIVNSLIQCTHVQGIDDVDNDDDNDVVAVVPRQRSPGGNHEQPDPMHTRQRWVSMGWQTADLTGKDTERYWVNLFRFHTFVTISTSVILDGLS